MSSGSNVFGIGGSLGPFSINISAGLTRSSSNTGFCFVADPCITPIKSIFKDPGKGFKGGIQFYAEDSNSPIETGVSQMICSTGRGIGSIITECNDETGGLSSGISIGAKAKTSTSIDDCIRLSFCTNSITRGVRNLW